ncbi:MAG: hypothetical protein PF517_01480 [Salinivirgaceae bacterium]|nr:hypothetical protein [Salinivirgaceae bacterium]
MDKNNLYKFKVGDTLIYKGTTVCDTFAVSRVEVSMTNSDKIHNYEMLGVDVTEVNNNCTSYCFGYVLVRRAEQSTTITFRNILRALPHNTSSNNSYQIGQYTINNVYIIENQNVETDNEKNVTTIWYTHKYGIIAYKLISGEELVLDEKCISEYM